MSKLSSEDIKKILKNNEPKSKKILSDEASYSDFMKELNKKMKNIKVNNKKLNELVENIELLISMVQDYYHKKYTAIPVKSILSVIGGLIYVLAPVDAIPDYIPVVGYVDDIAVIALVLKLIDSDLQDYKAWKAKQKNYKASQGLN